MSNATVGTKRNVDGPKWYETTLPVVLAIVLSVILVILIIVRIVQCYQERKSKKLSKGEKTKNRSGQESEVEGEAELPKSVSKKRNKFMKLGIHKETAAADSALIVPANENGSLLQSGIRAHPTRKTENKSWYDSKVIPYIDDGGASLDNLYLPENAIQEVA